MNKEKLIKISSKLLMPKLSSNREDYPKYIPRWLITDIIIHNNRLRELAIEIAEIAKQKGGE